MRTYKEIINPETFSSPRGWEKFHSASAEKHIAAWEAAAAEAAAVGCNAIAVSWVEEYPNGRCNKRVKIYPLSKSKEHCQTMGAYIGPVPKGDYVKN